MQLGGGIRDMKTVEGWLAKGVARIIIGTAAVRDPDFVREAARRHPDRIAVGIDAKDGRVAVEGWAQTSSMTADELGRRFEDAGVAAIVYTDIARDGVLKGLNIPMTLALADAVSIPVIASGGLASIADVERLLEPDCARLAGAITGRALYDGRIDPKEALSLIEQVAASCGKVSAEVRDAGRKTEGTGRFAGVPSGLRGRLLRLDPGAWRVAAHRSPRRTGSREFSRGDRDVGA